MIRNIIDYPLKEGSGGFTPEKPFKIFLRSFPQAEEVRLHYHDSLEFNLYQHIQGQVFIMGREYALEKHQLIILPPRTLHSYIIPAQYGQMVVLQISFTHLNRYLNVEELLRSLDFIWEGMSFFTEKSDIQALCQKLIHGTDISLPDFLIWMIELLKALAVLGTQGGNHGTNTLTHEWLRKTMIHTEREYHRKLPLSEIARLNGFDPSYFSRLFKKHTGMNYKDYLLNVRLERSRELLSEGLSVSETAELSGFQDVSYFIKIFRGKSGITPLSYQKSFKKGELPASLVL